LFDGEDDDDGPTDAELDEEELVELLKERRNSKVH